MAHLTVILQASQPEVGRVMQTPDWPLHVTLLQAFRVDAATDQVEKSVVGTLRQVKPLEVRGTAVEYFGPSADIEVTVVDFPVRLLDVHWRLLTGLSALRGFESDAPAYSGDGYRPHVTACPSGSLPVGSSMRVSWAALVDMDGGPVVLSAISLRTPSSSDSGGGAVSAAGTRDGGPAVG